MSNMMSETVERQYTIKELRARYGLTQAALAEACGVTIPTAVRWEQSPATIRAYRLRQLADLFDVRMDEIFLSADVKKNNNAAQRH